MAQAKASETTGFREDLQGMGQTMSELKDDFSNLAHGAADAARSGAAELHLGARHAVEAAKGKAREAADAAGEATDSLRGVIARNPLASIGIAAGAGVLLGLLVLRSKSGIAREVIR